MSSTMVAGAIQLDAFRWMLPREGGMRVPGILFADRPLLERMMSDRTPEQVRNAAHLPGILEASIAMPDAHWGYGLPVGGVVATDPEDGVISPGAVGYDIGCGVRLLRSRLERVESRIVERVEDRLHVFDVDAVDLRHLRDQQVDQRTVGELHDEVVDGAAAAALEDLDPDDLAADGPDPARDRTERPRAIGQPHAHDVGLHGEERTVAL